MDKLDLKRVDFLVFNRNKDAGDTNQVQVTGFVCLLGTHEEGVHQPDSCEESGVRVFI